LQNNIKIKSATGDYSVIFNNKIDDFIADNIDFSYCIIDRKVWALYSETELFKKIHNPIFIDALETKKTVETALEIIGILLESGITRGKSIVGIGGGITQDIVTFLSSVLFRGVPWTFIPTTLLAQCDSCIGGKSSLNYKSWKNQIGNFYPPGKIMICPEFLGTLSELELRSGIGEMLKVHMVPGGDTYKKMHEYMKDIMSNSDTMLQAIYSALGVKKAVIEEDEFDTGLRLKMNLGHTFGHALEAASDYQIPHGIAVNIGILLASKFSLANKLISTSRNSEILNYSNTNMKVEDFSELDFDKFYMSLRKDKKNKENRYCFIVPTSDQGVEMKFFEMSDTTDKLIRNCIDELWGKK
jgi:3-dehydroquinate synthase